MTKAINTSTTSTSVKAFNFEGSDIRVVMLDGEPTFVGKDVCDHLGYSNATKAMNDHCKGVTRRYPLTTNGGLQEVRVLSEPDVLRLIVRSKLPEAVRFERLVFEEILPAIRKTGSYSVAPQIPRTLSEALRLAEDQAEQIEQQSKLLEVTQPKAEAFDLISEHKKDLCVMYARLLSNRVEGLFKKQSDRFSFVFDAVLKTEILNSFP